MKWLESPFSTPTIKESGWPMGGGRFNWTCFELIDIHSPGLIFQIRHRYNLYKSLLERQSSGWISLSVRKILSINLLFHIRKLGSFYLNSNQLTYSFFKWILNIFSKRMLGSCLCGQNRDVNNTLYILIISHHVEPKSLLDQYLLMLKVTNKTFYGSVPYRW